MCWLMHWVDIPADHRVRGLLDDEDKSVVDTIS